MEIIKKIVFLVGFIFVSVETSFGESAAIQSLPLQNVPFYEGIEEFSQRIQHIRETEQREPLGLVLCGGSARAFAHIGVLQAMEENGIVPETIKKDVREILEISSKDNVQEKIAKKRLSQNDKNQIIERLTKEMRAAAKLLEFEHAAYLRDQIEKIKNS